MSQSLQSLNLFTVQLDALLKETNNYSSTQWSRRTFLAPFDSSGNGTAVTDDGIKGEDIPWVRLFNHGFQGLWLVY